MQRHKYEEVAVVLSLESWPLSATRDLSDQLLATGDFRSVESKSARPSTVPGFCTPTRPRRRGLMSSPQSWPRRGHDRRGQGYGHGHGSRRYYCKKAWSESMKQRRVCRGPSVRSQASRRSPYSKPLPGIPTLLRRRLLPSHARPAHAHDPPPRKCST